ncbi:MAG: type II toxin-antitoxin system VapC family toxin [Luteolibacter sp.]
MNVYPDTSFLCSLYRKQDTSPQAVAYQKQLSEPLPVSTLLLLEFRQSIRFQARLFEKDRSKGFSKTEGAAMLRALQSDLADSILEMVAPDWADVHRIAEELSAKYTESGGHHLADILHVATAVHLGAAQFLTFDANQRKLAEAEGMVVLP